MIAKRIKMLRENQHLSQTDLSKKLGGYKKQHQCMGNGDFYTVYDLSSGTIQHVPRVYRLLTRT